MFFNIVFTQKERRKLAIFHLLEEQHELTIKEISKKLDLSSSVVKNILNEMENEFDDFAKIIPIKYDKITSDNCWFYAKYQETDYLGKQSVYEDIYDEYGNFVMKVIV